jgi:hypothetical protein
MSDFSAKFIAPKGFDAKEYAKVEREVVERDTREMPSVTLIKLLACPFCGGEARTIREEGDGRMSADWWATGCFHSIGDLDCPGFKVSTPHRTSSEQLWNRRSPRQAFTEAALVIGKQRAQWTAKYLKEDGWGEFDRAYESYIASEAPNG